MISINRQGATRVVILTARYAIKVPSFYSWKMFLLGLLGNMQERSFSKMNDQRLCPVLFSVPGGFCNVMPKADVMAPEEFIEFDYDGYVNGDHAPIPVERKWNSFGWLDGRVVAIDYGS